MKQLKPKKCKAASCRKEFIPRNGFQKVCSQFCAIELSRQQEVEKVKKESAKARREAKIKDRRYQTAKTQQAVNKYIRLRDEGKPCISCGRLHKGKMNAGHYRTVKSMPSLRFEPFNIHAQCEPCNSHLSGNLIEYRKGLIEKIGIEKVEWLEGPHEPKKHTVQELIDIRKHYTRLAKGLE